MIIKNIGLNMYYKEPANVKILKSKIESDIENYCFILFYFLTKSPQIKMRLKNFFNTLLSLSFFFHIFSLFYYLSFNLQRGKIKILNKE